jgi:hypothetical protein
MSMKTMLGFFGCCAAADVLATTTAATDANRPRQMFVVMFIAWVPY